MKNYKGKLNTKMYTIIPILLYVSKSIITSDKSKTNVYALHITPFIEIGVNKRNKNK